MKKINLRGLSKVLSEKELKNVLGGSSNDGDCMWWCECYWYSGYVEEGCCWEETIPQCLIAAEQKYYHDEFKGPFRTCLCVENQ